MAIELELVADGDVYDGETAAITGTGLAAVLTMTISDGATTAPQTVGTGSDESRPFTASLLDLPYTVDHNAGRLRSALAAEVA